MTLHDLMVVGAGPAGVSAAVYARRGGAEVTILRGPDSSLQRSDAIENYYGFPEPISGAELLQRGWDQAERLGIPILDQQAVSLSYDQGLVLTTDAAVFHPAAVVLATGAHRNAPRLPGLREYEGRGVSYCAACDGFFCRGKDVAVLGAGVFALSEVTELLHVAASVTLLTNSEPAPNLPQGAKAETRALDKLYGSEQLLEGVQLADGEKLPIARLFVALGTAGSAALARQLGAEVNGNAIAVDEAMQTSVPGVFAAGDCTGGLLQIAKAVHQGAVAGNSALIYLRKNKK